MFFKNEKTKQRLTYFVVILGPALAWLAHLMLTYALGEFGCVAEGEMFSFLGLSATGWGLVILSILSLAGCFLPLKLALKMKKAEVNRLEKYTAAFGLAAGTLFLFAVIAQSFPVFMLLKGC